MRQHRLCHPGPSGNFARWRLRLRHRRRRYERSLHDGRRRRRWFWRRFRCGYNGRRLRDGRRGRRWVRCRRGRRLHGIRQRGDGLAPLEVAPVQLVRLLPAWAAWQPWWCGPLAPRKPSKPPARRVRLAPLTRPPPTKLRPTAHARHPTRRARHALKLRPLARQPHARSARSNPPSPQFSALHYICPIAIKRGGGKRSTPGAIAFRNAPGGGQGGSRRTISSSSGRPGGVWRTPRQGNSSALPWVQRPRYACP